MSDRPGRRAIVLVIDACGVGALPDAADYGDEGTNTLAHVAQEVGGLRLATLAALGLGSIGSFLGVAPSVDPAVHGRLHPLGPGKDSIAGHWELMGVVMDRPLPTYPDGFPAKVVGRLEEALGYPLICNRPDNGLAAIEEFGAEHLGGAGLILYTSQDSVLQLAAHERRLSADGLYEACRRAREVMSGEQAVGRVIARPFVGEPGAFSRTSGRRDFSLAPPSRSYLEELVDEGVPVFGVGKIGDLFAGVGVSECRPGASNAEALDSVAALVEGGSGGLVFANLIETDQLYGHRKDPEGFARALSEIDRRLGSLLDELGEGDLLVVTADHGVDPRHPGTDHTREHAPLLSVTGEMLARRRAGTGMGGFRHDGPLADVGASVHSWLTGSGAQALPGEPFVGSGAPRS